MKGEPIKKDQLKDAVKYIRARTQVRPTIGVILGSGMEAFGDRLDSKEVFFYKDIPGFPIPTVPGHCGRLLIGNLRGKSVVVLQGRCHLYEGYTAAQVTFPIQVLALLGIRFLIVTSAAGAVSERISPGDIMLIQDHLNLTGDNPLRGLKGEDLPIFVDMTSAYDQKLMKTAEQAASQLGINHQRGVLAAVLGPSYETPVEVAMLRSLGVGAVCMSAVPEVILARYLNLRVLGMALITNRAADQSALSSALGGLGGRDTGQLQRSGHQRVLEVARGKTEQVSAILERVVEAVGE